MGLVPVKKNRYFDNSPALVRQSWQVFSFVLVEFGKTLCCSGKNFNSMS